MKYLEDENEIIRDELNQLRKCVVNSIKYKNCNSFRTEIEDLLEILSKFIKGRDNLYMILSNQRASYNKVGLGYQPNNNAKYFMSICIPKKKNNHTIHKCNYCYIIEHIEPYFF